MKILHVISGIDPRQGGPTSAVLAMIHAQADAGLKISVVATFGADFRADSADQLKKLGVDVHLIGPSTHVMAWHRDIKPTLRKLIAETNVVHIHAVWEEIQHQAARIARRLHKPYILTPHGMLDPWSLSQSRARKLLYLALRFRRDLNGASAIHFTTETERDLVSPLNIGAPSITGVDHRFDRFSAAAGQFRARFSQQIGDRPFALFMSRIHHKKGLDLLIPAFAKIKNDVRDAMLVIAGPDIGGYQGVVEKMSRDQGISDRVFFSGMLYGRDRAAALVDAQIFVLPSYQENFGVVVIESLAAGTPVIISDQVNIHRQISDANVGEVIPTNVDRLAEALRRWFNDSSLRENASTRAIEFVQMNFDRRAQAQQWIEHYSRIANHTT